MKVQQNGRGKERIYDWPKQMFGTVAGNEGIRDVDTLSKKKARFARKTRRRAESSRGVTGREGEATYDCL